MYFDPWLMVLISPALLLAFIAQIMVSRAYSRANQVSASMSGHDAAREILDSAGLYDVGIEQVHGHLTDHYDPRDRVLRLSDEVYHNHSMAAVGIAAHEAGHALQHAYGYAPLTIRNLAVPVANFGSGFGMIIMMVGMAFGLVAVAWAGLLLFGSVMAFQVINLPVEFNASSRAKDLLVQLGIVHSSEMSEVRKVLRAAALTYVAGTLQSILTFLYYAMRIMAAASSRDD
ncbi:MAG: zinc metallopeptidase [Planctomycetota bacterium]